MWVFGRAVAVVLGAALTMSVGSAQAQSVLGDPTNPAKSFASNCAICHKTPKGLAKTTSASELAGFLRQHYTTGKDSGASMAAYLLGAGPGAASESRARQGAEGERPPAAVGRTHEAAKDAAKPAAKDARGARAKGRKQEPAAEPDAAEHDAAGHGADEPAATAEPSSDIATEEPPRKPRQKAAARTKDARGAKPAAKQRPPATAAHSADPAQGAKDAAKDAAADKPAAAGGATAGAAPAPSAAASTSEGSSAGGEKPSFAAPLP